MYHRIAPRELKAETILADDGRRGTPPQPGAAPA
jgi:hypothetical protein